METLKRAYLTKDIVSYIFTKIVCEIDNAANDPNRVKSLLYSFRFLRFGLSENDVMNYLRLYVVLKIWLNRNHDVKFQPSFKRFMKNPRTWSCQNCAEFIFDNKSNKEFAKRVKKHVKNCCWTLNVVSLKIDEKYNTGKGVMIRVSDTIPKKYSFSWICCICKEEFYKWNVTEIHSHMDTCWKRKMKCSGCLVKKRAKEMYDSGHFHLPCWGRKNEPCSWCKKESLQSFEWNDSMFYDHKRNCKMQNCVEVTKKCPLIDSGFCGYKIRGEFSKHDKHTDSVVRGFDDEVQQHYLKCKKMSISCKRCNCFYFHEDYKKHQHF